MYNTSYITFMYAHILYDVIYIVYLLFWHVDDIFYFANFTYVPYFILLHFQIYIYRCLNFYLYMHIYIYIVCMYMYMMICAGCFYCMILAHYTYVWYSILLHLQTYVYIYMYVSYSILLHLPTYTYIYMLKHISICAYIYTCIWLYLQGALIACCLDYCLPWQGWAKWFGDWHRFCML